MGIFPFTVIIFHKHMVQLYMFIFIAMLGNKNSTQAYGFIILIYINHNHTMNTHHAPCLYASTTEPLAIHQTDRQLDS